MDRGGKMCSVIFYTKLIQPYPVGDVILFGWRESSDRCRGEICSLFSMNFLGKRQCVITRIAFYDTE